MSPLSRRLHSSSLRLAGAYFDPSASLPIVSVFRPRSRLSIPRTMARGVSACMMNALDARRRKASYTSPAIAERSPEPA
jgi:hypothetical protein